MCIKLLVEAAPPLSSSHHRRKEACTLWNDRLSILCSTASQYARPGTMDAGSHVNSVSPKNGNAEMFKDVKCKIYRKINARCPVLSLPCPWSADAHPCILPRVLHDKPRACKIPE